MSKITYLPRTFSPKSKKVIKQANEIIEEYTAQGFRLTLRQLYYQFVSRDLLANTTENYKRLGSILNDARLAGLVDWESIEDRTRNLHKLASWSGPQQILEAVADQFRKDLWEDQPYRPEVWIEKEALAGVFEGVCDELRVPFFCCRGYTSQSEMWVAGQRLRDWARGGQTPYLLHFGDHDPSGIDMTRDVRDRLEMFTRKEVRLDRLALNMDQVNQYRPPPNPAKVTDSRYTGYLAEYGHQSWELDALEPSVLAGLVRTAITSLLNSRRWRIAKEGEEEDRRKLSKVAEKWESLTRRL